MSGGYTVEECAESPYFASCETTFLLFILSISVKGAPSSSTYKIWYSSLFFRSFILTLNPFNTSPNFQSSEEGEDCLLEERRPNPFGLNFFESGSCEAESDERDVAEVDAEAAKAFKSFEVGFPGSNSNNHSSPFPSPPLPLPFILSIPMIVLE